MFYQMGLITMKGLFKRYTQSKEKRRIADIKPNTSRVDIGDGYVELRGLNVSDITMLVAEFGDVLNAIFSNVRIDTANHAAEDLMMHAPKLAIACVALAADELDQFEKIENLPLETQIEMIAAVYSLTFPSGENSVKKCAMLAKPILNKIAEQVSQRTK
jgi:hypothetical protein